MREDLSFVLYIIAVCAFFVASFIGHLINGMARTKKLFWKVRIISGYGNIPIVWFVALGAWLLIAAASFVSARSLDTGCYDEASGVGHVFMRHCGR